MFSLLWEKRRPTNSFKPGSSYLNLSLITIEVPWSMPFFSSLMDFKVISVDSLTEKAVHNRSRMTFSETSDCFCADLMSIEELGWECRVSSCCDF